MGLGAISLFGGRNDYPEKRVDAVAQGNKNTQSRLIQEQNPKMNSVFTAACRG